MAGVIIGTLLNGVLLGLVKCFYMLMPAPMNELLYCTFLGFTVTTVCGAQWKKTGHYLGGFGVGILFTEAYIWTEKLFLKGNLPELMECVMAFAVVSFLIEISNILVTRDTPFGMIPLQFAVVIGVFSRKGQDISYVMAALVIGMAVAIVSKSIYLKFSIHNGKWRVNTLWKKK